MWPCCHWQNFMRLKISIKKLRMMMTQNVDQILFREIHKLRCKKYLNSWIFAKFRFWSVRPKKTFKGQRMWFFQSLAEVQCFTVHAYMLTCWLPALYTLRDRGTVKVHLCLHRYHVHQCIPKGLLMDLRVTVYTFECQLTYIVHVCSESFISFSNRESGLWLIQKEIC